jgi:hypothetical protein
MKDEEPEVEEPPAWESPLEVDPGLATACVIKVLHGLVFLYINQPSV